MSRERFHVGHNLIGLEPIAVDCFRHWRIAAFHLIADMHQYADHDDEITAELASPETTGYATEEEWLQSDDYPGMRASVDSLLQDDPPVLNQDYNAEVENNDGHRVAFWLIRTQCEHK